MRTPARRLLQKRSCIAELRRLALLDPDPEELGPTAQAGGRLRVRFSTRSPRRSTLIGLVL